MTSLELTWIRRRRGGVDQGGQRRLLPKIHPGWASRERTTGVGSAPGGQDFQQNLVGHNHPGTLKSSSPSLAPAASGASLTASLWAT